MIRRIVVINPKGESLDIDISKPQESGVNVINVTGISPANAEIYSTPFGSIDGAVYAGSRVPSRNIVLTLGMMFDPEIEDSRHKVYNMFRIKDQVTMIFITDSYKSGRVSQITGFVESVDVDIFSKQETATVSVVCLDPWFLSLDIDEFAFAGYMGCFEFPFENDALSGPQLEFGIVNIDRRANLFYRGDIERGFTMKIFINGSDVKNIRIYNVDTREIMYIYTDKIEKIMGRSLREGDELAIFTQSGQKGAYMVVNDVYTNVISAIDKNSDWFKLSKGDNVFAYACDSGEDKILIDMVYQNAYGGI